MALQNSWSSGIAELKLSNPPNSCSLLASEPVIEKISRGTTHSEPTAPSREVPPLILREGLCPHYISNTSIKLQGWVTRDLMFCNERLIFLNYTWGQGVCVAELCQWKCHNGDITSRLLRLPPTDVPKVETKEWTS